METYFGVMVVITALLAVIALLWLMLPFAIFGTKPRLEAIANELRQTNAKLDKLIAQHGNRDAEPDAAPPVPPTKGGPN